MFVLIPKKKETTAAMKIVEDYIGKHFYQEHDNNVDVDNSSPIKIFHLEGFHIADGNDISPVGVGIN